MTDLGGKAVERGNSETLLDFRGTDGFILARLVPLALVTALLVLLTLILVFAHPSGAGAHQPAPTSAQVLSGVMTIAAFAILFYGRNQGRGRHRLTQDTLSVRSHGFSKDIPVASIAGVGLVRGTVRALIRTRPVWTPFVWNVDGTWTRLLGFSVLEREGSDLELLRTRAGHVAQRLYTEVAEIQGPTGPLIQHHIQIPATSLSAIIELLPAMRGERQPFRRWNLGSGWQPEEELLA